MEGKGTKKREWLEFPFPNTGDKIKLPIGTVIGEEDGPTLVVVGGMHGSEFPGIQGAIDIFNFVDPAKLKGKLIVCTIYNLPAFVSHAGFVVPLDGKNPGRTFPGRRNGTYSEVMAYYLNEHVLSKADYYLELHGGDIPEALTPNIFCPITGDEAVDKQCLELALAYDIKVIIKTPAKPSDNPGSAFGKLALRGIPAILTESGQQGILDMEDAKRHFEGIKNVMYHLGMLKGQMKKEVEPTMVKYHGAVRSELTGMWYPEVKLNQMVEKAQKIGEIRDYFGGFLAEVKAPVDGLVTVVRTSPAVAPSNVLIELHELE